MYVWNSKGSIAGYIGTVFLYGNSDGTFDYAYLYNCVNRAHNGVRLAYPNNDVVEMKKELFF